MARTTSASITITAPPPATGQTLDQAAVTLHNQVSSGGSRWLLVHQNDANQNAGLDGLPTPHDIGCITFYSSKGVWNPIDRCIEFIGGDHQLADPVLGALYEPHWVRHYADSRGWVIENVWPETIPTGGHGYDHIACDPRTGNVYWKQFNSAAGLHFHTKTAGQHAWTDGPIYSPFSGQVSGGVCWWEGAYPTTTQGCLMVWDGNSLTGGLLTAWNPVTQAWIPYRAITVAGVNHDYYDAVLAYSRAKNVAVHSCGGQFPRICGRISGDGSWTQMPTFPTAPSGITNPGFSVTTGNFCADPVGGNFILLTAHQLWELNPDGSGTWTRLDSDSLRTPPSTLLKGSGEDITSQGGGDGSIVCSLPDHGCIAYIRQRNATTGDFWLYQHSP